MNPNVEKIIQVVNQLNSVFKNLEHLITHYKEEIVTKQDDAATKDKLTIINALNTIISIEKKQKTDEIKNEDLKPLLAFQNEQIQLLELLLKLIPQMQDAPELTESIRPLVDKIHTSILEEGKKIPS